MRMKLWKCKKSINKSGFTLIEVIVSLFVISVSVILFSNVIAVLKRSDFHLYATKDNNSIHQMRFLYALSKEVNLDGDMLSFTTLDDEMYFELLDDRLVLQSGYQVFFMGLSDAYFYEKESCMYFAYERNQQWLERVIGCK